MGTNNNNNEMAAAAPEAPQALLQQSASTQLTMTDPNENNMKHQDKPDKATRVLQRAQREKLFREMIKAMEFLYDWLDSGESFEGLAIRVDIIAAGTALSELDHKIWRNGLELIRGAREQGLDRKEAITSLREIAKEICEITEREGWR